MSEFSLATANTHYGRMARAVDGMAPFVERNVDIVTLQEVRDPESDVFQSQLERSGYQLAHAVGVSGLAIAVRQKGSLTAVPESTRTHLLRTMQPFEEKLYSRGSKLVGQFPQRGLIAASFVVNEANEEYRIRDRDAIAKKEIRIATAHPLPPARPRARRVQVNSIGQLLQHTYFSGDVIVSGDWNHYPAPHSSDRLMRTAANLRVVDIGKQPTWTFNDSPRKWAAQLVSMARYPTSQNLAALGQKHLEEFGGQLDALLYRGSNLQCTGAEVVPIESDHRAIVASFCIRHTCET